MIAILESITNMSLKEIAINEGMRVDARKIHVDDLGGFKEIAACGTAVVVTPVSHIHRGEKVHYFS